MKMNRKQKAEMNEFFEEMDTIKGMEATYSGDADMPDNVPLLEDFSEEEEDEELSAEELEAFLENVNFENSNNSLSFDEMMPKVVQETGVKFQRKEKIVTPHFLVIREYVERTPSVCNYRDCFYDGAKAISFKDWNKCPEKKRKLALAALERHIQIKHKFTDTDIIDKAELPTSWMSPTIL